MWELDYKESWTHKNWCFWTVVLEKTLESPFHLKDISSEYSLEGLIFKLKLQYFGHLLWRADSFEKTLILEKIEGGRRRGWQDEMVGWHHRLNGYGYGSWWWTGRPGLLQPWGHKVSDMIEQLNWTDNIMLYIFNSFVRKCLFIYDIHDWGYLV